MIRRLVHERLGSLTRSTIFSKLLWRDISDDYTRTLSSVIGGWFNPGNLFCFDYAIGNLPSESPIVEIGSFCGLSTNLINYYKARHKVVNPLICCDKWTTHSGDSTIAGSRLTERDLAAFMREAYMNSTRAFSKEDLPYGVEMFSGPFFEAWQERKVLNDVTGRPVQLGGGISFCFVDGGHDYPVVKQDFDNVHKLLDKGGFILFDDSSMFSPFQGVRKVVHEVKFSPDYELVMRNPNYMFRKK
ncbi:MAG: class I SAM-dependent methyltransferase [Desulfomonile tiedjei]|nr:class I SAM-dependent methyltransferase [Desulfomonile tiedjei]